MSSLSIRGRLFAVLLASVALSLAPAGARAAPLDVASTHAYLVAAYNVLHATVSKWSAVEASIHKLNRKLAAECPKVGTGSPQDEESQNMSDEVMDALWATGYRTDARFVRRFVHTLAPLRWSNPAITRASRGLVKGLREMIALHVPPLCQDIRAWAAAGYRKVPARTLTYDKHVEAIQVKEIPVHLLRPFVQPADTRLASQDIRLYRRFEELEVGRGFEDWDMLLETLEVQQ